jgi:hypothetical protein
MGDMSNRTQKGAKFKLRHYRTGTCLADKAIQCYGGNFVGAGERAC